ncbi:MAG: fluoride efflux transporter FluC [Evtepia gabavorous]
MFCNCLAVGAGGALGAVCRYGMSLLPVLQRGAFPLPTLLTNLLGAILIGLVVGAGQRWANLSPTLLLFLRVGVCGGFTTFSTFSWNPWSCWRTAGRCSSAGTYSSA